MSTPKRRHKWVARFGVGGVRDGEYCLRCPLSRRYATDPVAVLYYHPARSPSIYRLRHAVPPCEPTPKEHP